MQLVFIKILALLLLPEFLSSVFIQSYMLYRNATFDQSRFITGANPSGERKKCFRVRRRIRYQRIQEENESGCSCGP